MTVGAWISRAAPMAWLAPALRPPVVVTAIFAAAVLFPIVHPNDADIDSAANALTFAALALGLNIVVGLAGLLDLGYAAFFAIGAYAYGIAASYQLTPEWSSFWEPFAWLGLVQHGVGGSPGTIADSMMAPARRNPSRDGTAALDVLRSSQ